MNESSAHATGVPQEIGGVSHTRLLVDNEIGEKR
jgi:hypothetical protein